MEILGFQFLGKRLDAENGFLLDTSEISLHDHVVNMLEFDRYYKKLRLHMEGCQYNSNHEDTGPYDYMMSFCNVLGFKMTSADFWGPSGRINGCSYIPDEQRVLLPELQERYKREDANGYSAPYSPFAPGKKYIEAEIEFISGDRLTVVCEEILFSE